MPDITYTSPLSKVSYTWTPKNPDYVPTEDDYRDFAAEIEQRETGTEQSAVGAMASSAAQGLTSIPGTVAQGVGALTGLTDLEQSGKYFAQKARELTPIDPMRRNDLSVELAGAAGQAVGQLGMALATGGGSLGTSVLLGSAAAMGAASGAESAESRGLEGARRYGEILGYAGTEILTERLFGLGSKTFFKPAAEAGGKVAKSAKTILGEAAEESLAGFGTNVVSNLTAVGLDIPSPELFTAEAFKSYARQGLAGAVGGTIFAGAQLAMGKQATQESITRKFAIIDGERREVTNFTDEELASAGVDPSTIEQQTFVSPIDAEAINSATPGARTILEGVYGNELEVPIGKPTAEQEQTFDEIIAADAAKKAAAAAAGVPTPAATEAAVLPTDVNAPAAKAVSPTAETVLPTETTVPPPVAGAPIVPPTTPLPDATTEGIIPENGFQERVQTDEGGAPPETGSGDRSFTSGQGQTPVVQEQAVTPPLPSGATPTEPGTLPTTPMTGVSGEVAPGVTPTAATVTAQNLPVGENTLGAVIKTPGEGPLASKAKTLLENVRRQAKAGVPTNAVETPQGNVEFVTPEMAPGIPQPARRKPLNDAVVKETVRKVFGTIPSNLSFINIDRQVDGMASVKAQTIDVNLRYIPNAKRLEEVLRHEATHLIYQDPLVQADIELLKQEIPADLAAEVDRLYSDPEFTESIRKEEAVVRLVERLKGSPKSLNAWERFVESVRVAFRKLFGRSPTPRELNQAANRILERAVANVAVQRTDAQPADTGDASDVRLAFAGEQSIQNLSGERRKFMADSLDAAKAMAAAGKSSEEIRAVTGWFPGKYDGKMRWEIPDGSAVLNENPEIPRLREELVNAVSRFEEIKARKEGFTPAFNEAQGLMGNAQDKLSRALDKSDITTVGERLEHPDFFESYPAAKNIRLEVATMQSNYGGYFDPLNNKIAVNSTKSKEQRLSTLLHELQHWVQKQEDLAEGGDLSEFLYSDDFKLSDEEQTTVNSIDSKLSALKEELRVLDEYFRNLTDSEKGVGKNEKQSQRDESIRYEIRDLNNKKRSIIEPARNRMAMDKYWRTAGEIEARDVQARQNLTPERLRATAPYSSENIAEEDAIVMFGSGGPQASMSMPSPEAQRIDQEYLAAVEAGDMETAERIVGEAAQAAGNTTKIYHGSNSKFTRAVTPLFLADENTAIGYSVKRAEEYGPDGTPIVYKIYANLGNIASEDTVKEIAVELGLKVENDMAFSVLDPNISPSKSKAVIKELTRQGYNSAQIDDFAVDNPNSVIKSTVVFSPNQIKSANAVERDDAGKIILPSERFQKTSDDIRYSMTPVDDSDVLGYTTQVFGEKMSVAEVESIKEIYASIRKTLFDYTQPVTDASLQEFYLLYNSIRPTESGKADILWLKDFGTETAYPGAVLGALFAFSDKIPDGGQAQREIIELIERSRLFPEQSFSDFWTRDSSTGTVTEGGRALGARSFIIKYLNKLRGVLSHRALRIEAASKNTNLPAVDIKAIDVSTNGQADAGRVAEGLDKTKTPGGTNVAKALEGAAQPESKTDPRKKPENSTATDPKTSSELAAKRLIDKYNTKKTKKIEKKEADVVTVLFKEHLSLKGGQSSADLKQKLIDAGLSPATAAELTATAENELNRLLQAERDRDSKPMEGADALSPSDKSAKAIVSKLAVSQSDTWSWPDPANKDPVVELVARYYKANGNMTNEQLDRELEKLKVEEGLRAVLVNAVSAELSKKKSVAQAKDADVEKDALAIINKLSQTQSDTLSWPIEKPTSPIVELVTRFYDANGSMSAQALDAELIKLGLPTRSRIILVNSVSAELSKRQAVKAAREKLIAENKPTKSAESFAANWQKAQDAPKDAKDTEQDPVRSILNQLTKVGRGEFHFDLSPDGKALFFDIVYKKLLGLNVSEKAAMAATSAAYQKYLTNRANQIAALRTMVAEKGLSKALAREMMNITATNQRDPEYAKKFIKQVLLDAGIPEDIADASLPLLLPSFQKVLADTREKLLRDFIDGRPKGAKRIPKPVVDEFLKAVRLGATNPDYEPSTPFAKANKWRNFTRAEHDEMARLDEIAMDPMQTRQEQQIALAGIAEIISSKVTEYERLVAAAEIYRNSALSNFLTTGGIQVWTPVFSSAARVLTDGVVGLVKDGNFNRFIASVESFMRAASPTALKSELFSAFGQNITTFNKAYEIDNQAKLNELSNLHTILQNSIKTWKTTKNPLAKAKALIGITYGSMDYVRRAYASLDNVSQSVFYRQIMDLGVRDIILKANGTEADFRNMISNRTRRHEQIVTELISQGQSPSRAWVNASEISRREMAGEIVDIYGEDVGAQVEAQDVISRKEAARELGVASDAELDGHVIPMLIDTIKGLSKASDNRMAGSGNLTSLILFGFPITALKVMNRSLDYSPVGYARLKMSERETKKYANDPEYKSKYPSFKTDNQKQQRMAESMVGTLGLIALLAMVMAERDKEPEDRMFMVHNAGPRDRAARQIWRAAGNEPQSVQFRFGTNSPWLGISWAKAGLEVFAPIFAVAGATFDSTDPTIRREDAYDQVMVFASQSLASMSRPLSSIQDTAGVLSGKEMSLSSRSLANQIGFRASSFLPWSSLARNYNKWQGARDTTNALSAFSSMIPIVGPSLTEPALNSLGDPIGKTPNEYSYKLGTAIPVSVGLRREDTPLYEFLLSKGKFPTAISRPTQEKKYGKMSDETWRKYIEVRGQNLKSLILKRKDSLEKLDAERYDDAIENLTDIANDRARATLKMRPAPK